MTGDDLTDLAAFVAVARAGSFTRAAALLGRSQPALSRTIRALEARLGEALLARTTRNVALTDAGAQLLTTIAPALAVIEDGLVQLSHGRAEPAGVIKLTMTQQAAASRLRPILPAFLRRYPEIRIELETDDAFTDIISGRFDAGVRFGGHIDRDMIALRIGPDVRPLVLCAPEYLARHAPPFVPRDLLNHDCITYRLPSSGGVYAWEFEDAGRRFSVRVSGSLLLNDAESIRHAALDGIGLAYLFEDQVADDLATGRLVILLREWCPITVGYHIYYPDRRSVSTALRLLIVALREASTNQTP